VAGNRPPATKLQAARIAQGFTQASLIYAMTRRAVVLNIPTASRASLQTMVSRWENGHDEITDPGYRRLFREILGRTNEELGFTEEPTNDGAEELRERLTIARSIDPGTVELFRRQVDDMRHLDRRFGADPARPAQQPSRRCRRPADLRRRLRAPGATRRRRYPRRLGVPRPRRRSGGLAPPRDRQSRSQRGRLTVPARLRHRPTGVHPARPRRDRHSGRTTRPRPGHRQRRRRTRTAARLAHGSPRRDPRRHSPTPRNPADSRHK